jgi:hypothetical protein
VPESLPVLVFVSTAAFFLLRHRSHATAVFASIPTNQPLRNPSRGQPNPHEPQRTLLLPSIPSTQLSPQTLNVSHLPRFSKGSIQLTLGLLLLHRLADIANFLTFTFPFPLFRPGAGIVRNHGFITWKWLIIIAVWRV